MGLGGNSGEEHRIRTSGEKLGARFVQNILYPCINLSSNEKGWNAVAVSLFSPSLFHDNSVDRNFAHL